MKGYTGKVLFVDLTQRSWHTETIPDEIYEDYLSGVGLGATGKEVRPDDVK